MLPWVPLFFVCSQCWIFKGSSICTRTPSRYKPIPPLHSIAESILFYCFLRSLTGVCFWIYGGDSVLHCVAFSQKRLSSFYDISTTFKCMLLVEPWNSTGVFLFNFAMDLIVLIRLHLCMWNLNLNEACSKVRSSQRFEDLYQSLILNSVPSFSQILEVSLDNVKR